MKSVKLRNSSTCFIDPETGFAISGDEIVELPARIGARTRERIQAGGLIIIEGKETPPVVEKPVESKPEAKVDVDDDIGEAFSESDVDAWRFYDRDEVYEMHYFDLYRLAMAFGMSFKPKKPKIDRLREEFLAHQEVMKASL